jgi:hypothetical protein
MGSTSRGVDIASLVLATAGAALACGAAALRAARVRSAWTLLTVAIAAYGWT